MKIGFDRQNTLMSCPSAIGARSTSIGAPAAMVEASGFIWEMKGQSVATPPTAAAAHVATKRKSRRVGWSAEDAVVTIPNPFLAAAGGTARETPKADAQERDQVRLPAPATPAAAERPAFSTLEANQAVQNRSIGTLAERAQAHYPPANVQCAKSLHTVVLFTHLEYLAGCNLRFFSRTSPKIPGRFSGCALAWMWWPISSNLPAFRCQTGPSAGPGWTISIGSR